MAERRVFKPEEKMKIVMEGLSGTMEITELCRKYGIATSRFYDWKDKLVKNSSDIFDGRGRKNTSDQRVIVELRGEIIRLKNEMPELKMIEKEIESRSSESEDIKHLTGMKGMEPVNSATIVPEIGNIDQFDSALKLQPYGVKCPDMAGSVL